MRIPEEKIEEIRNTASIVDVISGYLPLRKRGRNFIGLCPFHPEKTPSFTVSEEKSIFHCFGCHAGGNVFKFLMDYKNISFVEAVEEVADHVGIKIEYDKSKVGQVQEENEELYEINTLAARFFSNNLLKSDGGELARKYLEDRKVKLQIQRSFGLGYAPDSWDSFYKYAHDNKVDPVKAKEIGLLDAKEGGSYYDKFRHRLIFPIFSPNGRVIAFGGRVLRKDEKSAKYLNSPESIIYQKRKSLYGLYHSKDEIRRLDKALLVEGYMDLISLYQNDVKNVVASSGTALTEEQVQLLSRFTKNIVIIFDADPAGQKAAVRSIEILLKKDFEVKILELPEGEDPDSYINKYTKEDFDRLVNNSKDFLHFQTEQYEKKGDLADPLKQSSAIKELVRTASFVDDELKRSLLLKSIAKKFNLRESLLENELNKIIEASNHLTNVRSTVEAKTKREKVEPAAEETIKSKKFELDIIRLLLSDDSKIIGYIFDHIHPDSIKNKKLKDVARKFFEEFKKGNYKSANILDLVEDEELQIYLRSVTMDNNSTSKRWLQKTLEDEKAKDSIEYAIELVKNYNLNIINDELERLNKSLTSASDEEVLEIMAAINKLQSDRKKHLSGE